MNELLSHLKKCPPLADAMPEELDQLASGSKVRSFGAKEPIYLPSDSADSVYVLLEGRVALGQVSTLGKRSWLMFVDPGQLFGEQALIGWPRREQFAETFGSSQVVVISAECIQRLITESPTLATAMLKNTGERLMKMGRRWSRQFYLSTRERIIHVLLDLAEQYGIRTTDGIELRIDLSHDDIASFVGSTRESVSVEFAKLRSSGLVSSRRRSVVIRDLTTLRKLVFREPSGHRQSLICGSVATEGCPPVEARR